MKSLKLFTALLMCNSAFSYQPTETEDNSTAQEQYQIIPLVLGWIEKPPYTVALTNGSLGKGFEGMVPDATQQFIIMQCGRKVNVEYRVTSRKFEQEFDLLEHLRQNRVDIAMPIFEDANVRKHSEFLFIKLDDYPGTEYISVHNAEASLRVALDQVKKSWPLLVIILVLTAIAGVVMWALDRHWNSEEFSRSFMKGSWDGFWWSFISMTTVGYGDKSPKSIVARIFSIFWIMIGLIAMAIFTANLTSALTAASLDITPSMLHGRKIGVLGNGTEYQHVLQEDAHPTEYSTIDDILEAINTNEVDGMMLDSYSASFYQKKDKLKSLVTAKNFGLRGDVGILFSKNRLILARCLEFYRSEIGTLVQTITAKFQLEQQKPYKSVSLFALSSPPIKQFLFLSIGVLVGLILIGLLWEGFVTKRANLKRNKAAVETINRGFALSKGNETIHDDVEIARILFSKLEEQLRKMEAKALSRIGKPLEP